MMKVASFSSAVALLSLVAVVQAQSGLEGEGLRPLSEVETLVFRSDTWTSSIPSHPQLACTGECPESSSNEAICSNHGVNDMGAVVWQCHFLATGNNGIRQPKIECKGRMHSRKQYLLPGTCRMTYEGTKGVGKWNLGRAAACMDVISTVVDGFKMAKDPGSLLTKAKKLHGFRKLTKSAGVVASAASSVWQCIQDQQTVELHEVTAYVTATLEQLY